MVVFGVVGSVVGVLLVAVPPTPTNKGAVGLAGAALGAVIFAAVAWLAIWRRRPSTGRRLRVSSTLAGLLFGFAEAGWFGPLWAGIAIVVVGAIEVMMIGYVIRAWTGPLPDSGIGRRAPPRSHRDES